MDNLKKCKYCGSEAEFDFGGVREIQGIPWTTCYVSCTKTNNKFCENELTATFDSDDSGNNILDKLIKLWNEVNA